MLSKTVARFFSSAANAGKPHVWVNKNTKVICQGITGKQVSAILHSCNPNYTILFHPYILNLFSFTYKNIGYIPN